MARRAIAVGVLVLAARVLGLTLVVPALPLHGASLGGSLALVGAAVGAYGLTMALLQIPFGVLSDRWGRRPALLLGLTITMAGAVGAALAPTVPLLLLARLVQGAGAVNGVALALVAESAHPQRRTTALAIAGAAIGASAVLGIVAGGLAGPFVGARGLFLANATLVGVSALGVLAWVPAIPPTTRTATAHDVARALTAPTILHLAVAGLAVNLALQAVLFRFPLQGAELTGPRNASFALALAVLLGGLAMIAGARRADRGSPRAVALAAALALGAGAALLPLATTMTTLIITAVLFFAGQSVLAAIVPSLAARAAGDAVRGAAQSAVAVAGYLGVTLGPIAAGALAEHEFLLAGVGVGCGIAAAISVAQVTRHLPEAART